MAKQPDDYWDRYNHPALHYKKPKELKRFQTVVAFIASAALAFGLWSFVWYATSAWVKAEVTGWVDNQRASGAVVEYGEMHTTGFPSRITLNLTEPHYAGPAFGDVIEWKSDALQVSARPWTPWNLHVVASGKHDLMVADGALRFTGGVEKLVADVVLGDVWPESLKLQMSGLSMNGSGPLSIERLRIQMTHDPSTQAGGTALKLNVDGGNLVLPGVLPQPLGDRVQSIDMIARVTGAVVPGPAKVRVPAWRDSGGAIEFERLKFRSGPFGLAAGGTLAFDKNLQPQGAFTAKIEGLFQVLEILRARGVMSGGDAVAATMALSALSTRPKNGDTPSINVSATVQDGVLSLGPLKVLKMPVFDWGFPGHVAPTAPVAPVEPPPPPPRNYKDIKPVL